MIRKLRLLFPFALAMIGVGVLTGCIFIPTFGLPLHGKDLSEQVGEAGSGRVTVVGRATMAQVVKRFGTPDFASEDGLQIAYYWTRASWLWLGLCTGFEKTHDAIVLEFDRDGILRGFRTTHKGVTPILLNQSDEPDVRANSTTRPLPPTPKGWKPAPGSRPSTSSETRPAERGAR